MEERREAMRRRPDGYLARYQAGETWADIAATEGVTYQAVSRNVRRSYPDLPKRNSGHDRATEIDWTPAIDDRLKVLWASGLSTGRSANELV
jgi:hypothetical protein